MIKSEPIADNATMYCGGSKEREKFLALVKHLMKDEDLLKATGIVRFNCAEGMSRSLTLAIILVKILEGEIGYNNEIASKIIKARYENGYNSSLEKIIPENREELSEGGEIDKLLHKRDLTGMNFICLFKESLLAEVKNNSMKEYTPFQKDFIEKFYNTIRGLSTNYKYENSINPLELRTIEKGSNWLEDAYQNKPTEGANAELKTNEPALIQATNNR